MTNYNKICCNCINVMQAQTNRKEKEPRSHPSSPGHDTKEPRIDVNEKQ